MLEKFKSRKLFMAVIIVLIPIAAAVSGDMAWSEAVQAAVAAGAAYIFGQGYVDAQAKASRIIDSTTLKE